MEIEVVEDLEQPARDPVAAWTDVGDAAAVPREVRRTRRSALIVLPSTTDRSTPVSEMAVFSFALMAPRVFPSMRSSLPWTEMRLLSVNVQAIP